MILVHCPLLYIIFLFLFLSDGMMLSVIGLLIVCGLCRADYDCLCSYDVEKPVLNLVATKKIFFQRSRVLVIV